MQVRHPRYGLGTVKALTEHTADITFDDAPRTVDPAVSELTAAEPTANLTEMPWFASMQGGSERC